MKLLTTALCAAVALAGLPAGAQDITGGNEQVNLRVIHAVPGAPAASISIGANSLFSNVQFQQVTEFKSLPEQDDKTIKISLADGRTLQTKEEFSFDDPDEQYTVLITPDDSAPNPKVVVLKDDSEEIDSDETEVTIINASPSNKSINVRLDDDRMEGGVDYSDSQTEDVKPGSYSLQVVDSSNDTPIATKQVSFTGGTAVTLVVMGQDAVKIINNQMPDQDLTGAATAAGASMTTAGMSNTSGASAITTGAQRMQHEGMTTRATTGTGEMQPGRQPGTGTMMENTETAPDSNNM